LSYPRTTPRLLPAAGFLAVVAVLSWCLAALSGWVTRGQLLHEASNQVALLREQAPLWQWTLRRPSDLVAGRVFGTATLVASPLGLEITSRGGTPFELGLPLANPVDLAHWPLLRLDLRSDHGGSLGLIYQSQPSAAPCSADHAAAIPTGAAQAVIDLRTLAWRSGAGQACPPPAVVAYMLRLRVTLPAGSALTVRNAALTSAQPLSLPGAFDRQAADIRLTGSEATGIWIPPSKTPANPQAPLVRLPKGASAENMLLLRDRVRQHWPAAIILPFDQPLPNGLATRMPIWLDAGVCGIYLVWLGWLAARQRPGMIRPWTEVAAIAAGPLWLIAGLRWGPEPSLPGITAFLAALVYGGQSEWRRRPVEWGWWGRRVSDWLYPLVPLPVAAALTLADGHHLIHLDGRHVLAYLGWALLQQWAMLALVMGRLERTGLSRAAVILVTATLFALLHTPNGALMQLCLLAELWWAWSFMRSPRLLPIALAHAASALLMESGLTGHLLRSLEVSARFFL